MANLRVGIKTMTVDIANAATTSSAIQLDGVLVGLITDSGYDSGNITFTASTAIDGTFVAVKDATNAAVTITSAAASSWYALNPVALESLTYIKVVSATSQTGATTITLVTKAAGDLE